VDVAQRLCQKRKDKEKSDPVLQKKLRKEYILHKWNVFVKDIYEKNGKLYLRHKAVQIHIKDLKDLVRYLCEQDEENGRAEVSRTRIAALELEQCTEKFLASSAECAELRKKLDRLKTRRLSC